MASDYTRKYSLFDLFANKELKKVFPQISYKEYTDEKGALHQRTRVTTLPTLVYEISVQAAEPYYSPITPRRTQNTIEIGGKLTSSLTDAYNSVFRALTRNKNTLSQLANTIPMIRDAMKISARAVSKSGEMPKLYLSNANSYMQLRGLDKTKRAQVIRDVMNNLYYNPEFAEVQRKFKVPTDSPTYRANQTRWERRVK